MHIPRRRSRPLFKWSGSDLPENASLQLVKAGAGGAPQEKAGSTLTAGCTEVVG